MNQDLRNENQSHDQKEANILEENDFLNTLSSEEVLTLVEAIGESL